MAAFLQKDAFRKIDKRGVAFPRRFPDKSALCSAIERSCSP